MINIIYSLYFSCSYFTIIFHLQLQLTDQTLPLDSLLRSEHNSYLINLNNNIIINIIIIIIDPIIVYLGLVSPMIFKSAICKAGIKQLWHSIDDVLGDLM